MTAMHRIKELNAGAIVNVFGQELNDETWAIAQSDLMMQDIDPERMRNGNTLTQDAFPTEKFDYILANPPYGVDWKAYAAPIKDEHAKQGHHGRFGAGLPRVSDGSFLFLQHMLSHMKPDRLPRRHRPVRLAAVLRAGRVRRVRDPPLDPRERLARRHRRPAGPDVLQHRHLHLRLDPHQRQGRPRTRGTVKLVDARELGHQDAQVPRRQAQGAHPRRIDEIVRLYGGAATSSPTTPASRCSRNETFGFQRITVERPLRRRWEVTAEAVAARAVCGATPACRVSGSRPRRRCSPRSPD